MRLSSPPLILESSRFTPGGMDLDQNLILAQLRLRYIGQPQRALFPVALQNKCLHGTHFAR